MTAQWAVRAATGLRPQAKSSPVDRTSKSILERDAFFLFLAKNRKIFA